MKIKDIINIDILETKTEYKKCCSCGSFHIQKIKHCPDCENLIYKEIENKTLTLKHPILIKLNNIVFALWGLSFICDIIFIILWSFDFLDRFNLSGLNIFIISYLLLIGPMVLVSLIGQIQFEKDMK